LFEAWDKLYSVTKIECDRHELIQRIQGNQNGIIMSRCLNTTSLE
jgi:deoxyribonuclease-1